MDEFVQGPEIELPFGEEKTISFPTSGGLFRIETTHGSIFEVKFAPNTVFKITQRGDLSDLRVRITTGDVASPENWSVVSRGVEDDDV